MEIIGGQMWQSLVESKKIPKVLSSFIIVPALLGLLIAPSASLLWPLAIWNSFWTTSIMLAVIILIAIRVTYVFSIVTSRSKLIDLENLFLLFGVYFSLFIGLGYTWLVLPQKIKQESEQATSSNR